MRLNIERQRELEPKRIDFARKSITGLGYEILTDDGTAITFMFNGNIVTLWPYSGWHSGKSIKDGRGIQKLLNQIKAVGQKPNLKKSEQDSTSLNNKQSK